MVSYAPIAAHVPETLYAAWSYDGHGGVGGGLSPTGTSSVKIVREPTALIKLTKKACMPACQIERTSWP